MKEKKRILVVDDEEGILELFQRNLGKDFIVEITMDPHVAIEKIKNDSDYAVVISDICMPQVDGINFIKKVLSIQPEINIIAMTAYGSEEHLKKSIELNCFGYVDKPFDWEYMKSLVRKAVESY